MERQIFQNMGNKEIFEQYKWDVEHFTKIDG